MKFNELNITRHKTAKRVGRGISAGQGKTAGRGTKGQKARAGSTARPGFLGGQNPLMQQLPKLPGFRSYKSKAENVFTDQIDKLKTANVTTVELAAAKLISSPYANVKLLFRGDVTAKVNVSLPKASKAAIETLQSAGGSFTSVAVLARPVTQKSDKKAPKKSSK